jgi:hypothetical protein
MPALSRTDIAATQTCVSHRVQRWFVRRGWLDPLRVRIERDAQTNGRFLDNPKPSQKVLR